MPDLEPRRWAPSVSQARRVVPKAFFLGRGDHPLEVAIAVAEHRPLAEDVRALWRERQGHRPSPVLLVVGYEDAPLGVRLALCGPVGDHPPLYWDLEASQVERLAAVALAEPSRHAAAVFLRSVLPEVGTGLPGLRNTGLVATQELQQGVPARPDWGQACARGQAILSARGRALVERLGFAIEPLSATSSVLLVRGSKRAVAVFLDEGEAFDGAASRFQSASPVSHALALADREGLAWVVLARGRQLRLYAARVGAGVGRKGRADTYVEADLALLPADRAGYVPLLFGAEALAEGGTIEEILARSADFSANLGARLRDRIYMDAVPPLATAIAVATAGTRDEQALASAYEQTLVVLFRVLFVAYAEDKDLLPYRTNGRYRDHSLKLLARRLAQWSQDGTPFDLRATDLWDDVGALWTAVDGGNAGWGVPVYDGGLFSADPAVNPAGAALRALSLTDAQFGPALTALLVDAGRDGVRGPVDFRSLSVREFGTIYEGLLESNLSVAETDLALDREGTYVPAGTGKVAVPAGDVYFHNRSGARKATGSYFTKPFAVEHLLDHALRPALDAHLERIGVWLEQGDEAAAAEAFFDFRCADLAMGSGHFLVAAVDRIEAALADFLALRPIPHVLAELDTLRSAAQAALGPLAEGLEIENASLLRRQVARRCIYGVDRNRMAVELARLAVWIHTFVPGLPLSFLDHTLVAGDSLTGIGTIDEAVSVLDRRDTGQTSLHRDQIRRLLERARPALRRLARAAETTAADVAEARTAHAQALVAVEPARQLFDVLVAARLGQGDVPLDVREETLASSAGLPTAQGLAAQLRGTHFPVAFPEVFLRDRPGFDCIVGNPPWEEATVEELGFWALRFPGLKSLSAGQKKAQVARLRTDRPDLVREYERAVTTAEHVRRLLLAGPFPGMGTGDPDLYKAFAWRFWHLCREGGSIGVVLPRSAVSAKGSTSWRETVLDQGAFSDVTMLLNTGGWVFDEAEHRYSVGLVCVRKDRDKVGRVRLRGPFASRAAFDRGETQPGAEFSVAEFRSWSAEAAFPLLPTGQSVGVFLKLRRHPRMDARHGAWRARPATEFHATNDKHFLALDMPKIRDGAGMWPVFTGASFNLWVPDTGTYFAWADPDTVLTALQERRLRQHRNARSAFSEFDRAWAADPTTLPCRNPRVAFRDVARATDTRTLIAALIPPDVVATNKAPYLVWPTGDSADAAYVLGVLCSIPLDWYARRFVEISMNFHIFDALPVPRPGRGDPLRRRVVQIAGRLAAVDERYRSWADAVGVPVGSVPAAQKDDLTAELDAAVSLLYGLDESDVRHIFETFHVGWDYAPRLEAVLRHFRRLREAVR